MHAESPYPRRLQAQCPLAATHAMCCPVEFRTIRETTCTATKGSLEILRLPNDEEEAAHNSNE